MMIKTNLQKNIYLLINYITKILSFKNAISKLITYIKANKIGFQNQEISLIIISII